jgi:hypothetical protein
LHFLNQRRIALPQLIGAGSQLGSDAHGFAFLFNNEETGCAMLYADNHIRQILDHFSSQ